MNALFCNVKYCLFCLLTKKIRMAKEVDKCQRGLNQILHFWMLSSFKVSRYFTDVFRGKTRGHCVFGGISRMFEMGL